MDPAQPSGLDYYPLLSPGERFPVNDPSLEPRLSPRPADDVTFLKGLFEGIARIEAQCYRVIKESGGPEPSILATAGGAAKNPILRTIREANLGLKTKDAAQTEAAYGAARIPQLFAR